MSLEEIVRQSELFLPLFARVMGLVLLSPIFSARAIPAVAKVGLGFFLAFIALPQGEQDPFSLSEGGGGAFLLLILSEFLIGVMIASILRIAFATFQVAGQMFSLQMGFGASQVFDPLAQVQIPLVGQFLNLIAIYLFLAVGGIRRIFLVGLYHSLHALSPASLLQDQAYLADLFVHVLMALVRYALMIAFPMMGTLFLISVTIGLLSKAAPQMNLLMVGFPLQISIGFIVLIAATPFLVEGFLRIFDEGFRVITDMLIHYKGDR